MTDFLKPMLCHDAPKGPDGMPVLPTGPGWRMETKQDGWRFLWHRSALAAGDTRSYGGRNGSDHSGKALDIENRIASLVPPDTILDGELITTNPEMAVSTALSRFPTQLQAIVFDVVKIAGIDCRLYPWHQRREVLEAIDWGVGCVSLSASYGLSEALYHAWLEQGMEGAVVKRTGSKYHSGKRTREWLKLKPKATAEAVVLGYEMGKGESNKHLVGAIKFRVLADQGPGVESTCSPGTVENAIALTEAPEHWLGKTFEFKHYGFMPTGGPRHPTFYRWRPDRDQ